MRRIHVRTRYVLAIGLLAFLSASFIYGCASEKRAAPATSPSAPAPSAKGRAQIWAENCSRCHNMRGPDWYSDAEWEVAMQHMRVRGYLTGQEHKDIEQFLKAGN